MEPTSIGLLDHIEARMRTRINELTSVRPCEIVTVGQHSALKALIFDAERAVQELRMQTIRLNELRAQLANAAPDTAIVNWLIRLPADAAARVRELALRVRTWQCDPDPAPLERY